MILNNKTVPFDWWFDDVKKNFGIDKVLTALQVRQLDRVEFLNYYNQGMDTDEAAIEHLENNIY